MYGIPTRITKVAALGGLALLVAIGATSAQAESTLEKIKSTGKMLAGIRADKPPVGYYDENGELVGFAVDLARAVGEKLGVEVELVPVNAQTRIPYLTTGRIDAEFGSTTPTKERDEVVDFSIIYNWDKVVILVRAGDSLTPTDYGPPKKVVSRMRGGTYQQQGRCRARQRVRCQAVGQKVRG
jgi:polar amino acid transport system substrate-binding protein